ncbi:MAG: hypothetical protein JO016_18360 [Actinobacteria bacterium]|nr:hypothetical protein [Actinomycetota bacterium]
MTPSDDDFSWLLRRELHAEAARLTPAQDGLSQIRGQLGSRSVFTRWWGGVRVDAQRYGLHARHLLAEAADGLLRSLRWVAGRSSEATRDGARRGIVWLRPVVALAAVCIFAGTAAAVPGVRHAITNIGSSGNGSTTSVNGQGGSGGGTGAGTGIRQSGGGSPQPGGGTSTTASPSPGSTCSSVKAVPSVKPSGTKSGAATPTPTVTPTGSVSATPTTTPTTTPTPADSTGAGSPTPSDSSPSKRHHPHTGATSTSTSTQLSNVQPCHGPTPPPSGKGAAASNGASQLQTALPTPATEAPVSTPSTTAAATPTQSSTPTATASGASDPASTSSTTKSGSPWSAGFQKARGCRHHHQLHC